MILLYVLVIAYILAVNFYAFLLVKSLKQSQSESALSQDPANPTPAPAKTDKSTSKLIITGLLGGAITIYVCMFIMKYKRDNLLLMVLMPLLSVINVYAWVLIFKSGFGFLLIR